MSTPDTVGPRFPLWEVVLVVIVVVVIVVVALGRFKLSGTPTVPGSASAPNPVATGQTAEFLARLNQPVENEMTPAQEAEFLKRLNQPVKNQMTPEQGAEFLKRLNQPAQ